MEPICVELWYPRSDDRPDEINIDLVDVRASDGIKVSYDFDRDGWVVKQEKYKQENGHSQNTGEWLEVAFVQSWNLEE